MSTGGWYPDPEDPSRVRWWDGHWTEHVREPQPSPVATLAPAAPLPAPDPAPVAEPLPPLAPPTPPPAPPEPAAPSLDLAPVTPARPVSAGAALLPPLPGATPQPPGGSLAPGADDDKPNKKDKKDKQQDDGDGGRTRRSRITVVIAVLAIGLALFGALWFGGIISPKSEAPVASNPDAVVYEGPGYTVEVPKDWVQSSAELPPNIDVYYSTPTGAQLTIGSAEGNAAALQGDAALQSVVDTVVRVQRAVYPDVRVVSQEPTTLAGWPAQRVTLEGTSPAGTPVRVIELAALRDGTVVFLGLEGAPDAVAGATPGFDTAVATFASAD